MSIEETGATGVASEGAAASEKTIGDQIVESVPRDRGQPRAQSMEETLKAAYREQAGKGAFEEAEETSGETQSQVRADATGRLHGKGGRFAPKANGHANDATTGAAPTETAAEAAPDQSTAPAATANTNPDNLFRTSRDGQRYPVDISKSPDTWRPDAKAAFDALPEAARREIHKRESDMREGIAQYKEATNFAQSMARELIPYQETMNRFGKQPQEVVKEATAVWNTLATGSEQEKATLWLQIAKDYGINLSSLGAEPTQATTEQTQDDPRLAAALQRIDKLESHLTTQERQRAEAEFSTHVESVNAFGADPKHKHFDAVREDMAVLIESGRAKDLQEAYDKAIWSHPDVRASLLAEQEQERAKKLAADAAKARTAAGANVSRRGTPPVPSKPGSIEDTLKAGLRRLQA